MLDTGGGANAITALSGTLELTLAYENSLSSSSSGGIIGYNGANLVIGGTGSLEGSGTDVPFIGGGVAASAGNITLLGGSFILSKDKDLGSGLGSIIGGGYIPDGHYNSDASVGTITLCAASISAHNQGLGTGIGGGNVASVASGKASAGNIIITSGTNHIMAAAGSGIGIGTASTNADVSVGKLIITGGTTAVNSAIDKDVACSSIIINGGSLSPQAGASGVSPQPVNSLGEPVYLNVLTVGNPGVGHNVPITSGAINKVVCSTSTSPAPPAYGIHDVFTDASSAIYPWLPATNSEEQVVMKVGADVYFTIFRRPVGTVTHILEFTDPFGPSAFINPDGSIEANSPLVLSNPSVNLMGEDTQAIGTFYLNYYLDAHSSQITSIAGTTAKITFPEGRHSISYWASDATMQEARITKYYLIDLTAPTTRANYNAGQSFLLQSTDPGDTDASGVAASYYRLLKNGAVLTDNIATQTPYDKQPIKLNSSGTYTLEFYSVDKAGNTENLQSLTHVVFFPSPAPQSGFAGTGLFPATGDNSFVYFFSASILFGTGVTILTAVRAHRRSKPQSAPQ